MPVLAKQPVTVPLGGGLDTETAAKLLPLGKLLELENAIINQSGEIAKRPGHSATAAFSGLPWRLGTRKGAAVSISSAAATPIEVFAEGGDAGGARWKAITSQQRKPVSARRLAVYSGAGATPQGADVAYSAETNLFITVFDSLVTGANYQRTVIMQDATTGQVMYSTAATAVAYQTDPRVIMIGTYAVVAYHDNAGALSADVFTLANLEAGAAPTTVSVAIAAHHTNPYTDLAVGLTAGTCEIAYRTAANTTHRATLTVATAVVVDVEVTTAAAASINPSVGLAWLKDFGASGKLALATVSGATGLQVQWNLTAGLPATTYSIDASATAGVFGVTGHTISAVSSGEFVVLWNLPTLPAIKSDTKFGKRTVSGGVIAPVNFIRGMLIESKVFTSGGDVYVILGYASSLQPTYFMVRVSPTHDTTAVRAPLAWSMVTEAAPAGVAARPYLTAVAQTSTDFVAALQKQTRLETVGGGFLVDTGLDLVRLEFAPASSRPADSGDTLLVPGGALLAFDGASYAEYGHPLYPEGYVYTSTAGAAGALTVGDHQWCWVYKYTDNNGRIVRSQPSPVVTRTVVANDKITFTGLPARMHGRPATSDVVIEQYMTSANGSVFQLEKTIANDPTASTFTTTSEMSDTDLASQEFLYTTGGVLANNPISGTRAVLSFRDRVWFISDDDPSEIWVSSLTDKGIGYTFSDQLVIRKQDSHGDFTALAGMGLNLYMFKDDAIYAINGSGPNALGQGDFGEPQEVVTGDGVSDPRSVVTTPVGIFFKGPKGYRLMSGGAPQYIGAPVRAFESLTVTAAEAIPELQQVRFYAGTRTLVYDWFHQQWSVWVSAGTITTATIWNGRALIHYASNVSSIAAEDSAGEVWTDASDVYRLKFTTPWISYAGLQGVQRVYLIEGVGDLEDAHNLRATVLYDNDDGDSQTYERAFAASDDWDWRLKLARQRSAAFKITIEETPPGTDTQAFRATALMLIMGVEPAHLKRLQAVAQSLAAV